MRSCTSLIGTGNENVSVTTVGDDKMRVWDIDHRKLRKPPVLEALIGGLMTTRRFDRNIVTLSIPGREEGAGLLGDKICVQ